MKIMLKIIRPLFSTLAMLAVLMVATTASHAGGARIEFAGTVEARNNGVPQFPQTLVSFSNQAALPIEHIAYQGGEVRVFDLNGNRIKNTQTAYLPSGDGRQRAQLVNLSGAQNQVFVVCAGSRKNCMRYSVVHY